MEKGKEGFGKLVGEKVAAIFGLWSLVAKPHVLLEKIGLSSRHVYHNVPDECYICQGHSFSELSLLGIYYKPVFYECTQCQALHLKYDQDWLEGQFTGLKDVWVNPHDWIDDDPPREEYN